MNIFNEKKEIIATAKNTPISSIIGQDMVLTGDLVFNSKIQIDGKINGNLCGDSLIISATGKVEGDIEAKSITCHGRIDGNIEVGVLYLKKSGVINGRVETSDLSVESGGVLNGEIKSRQQSPDLKVLHGSAELPAPSETAKANKGQ